MLYNRKWELKPDLEFEGISLRAFIAWLETMPAEGEYHYTRPAECAAAQYLQSIGRSKSKSLVDFGPCPKPGDPGFWLEDILNHQPYTFGAALERAHEFAAVR